MKTLKSFLFFGIFLVVFVGFSCKSNGNDVEEDNDDSCDMVMTDDGRIQKPEWMKAIFDSIINNYGENPSIPIFTVRHDEQEYILFRDGSYYYNFPNGYLFVGCPRKRVAPESDLWWELMDEILPCGIILAGDGIQSPQWLVRAIDSISYHYLPIIVRKPDVYYLPYQEQDYILLVNTYNSSMQEGMNFFICNGEKVVPESEFHWEEPDFWGELAKEFYMKNGKILKIWSRF